MDKINQIIESGILEDYVLGLLNESDMSEVESYLSQYPELRSYIEGIERGVEKMAIDNAITPSPDLKSKIIESATQPVSVQKISSSTSWWKVAASFLLGIVLCGSLLFNKINNIQSEISELKKSMALKDEECQKAKEFLSKNEELIFFLKHEATIPVQLDNNTTNMVVYHNPVAKKTKLKVKDLPEINSSETYQMWADVKGKMIDMGTFSTGQDYRDLKYIAEAESFNVTIEPAGGSDHPTVSRLLVSNKV